MTRSEIDAFIARQLSQWPLAADNHKALGNAITREIQSQGYIYKAVALPSRAASCKADVSAGAIAARKCFLCTDSLPPQQLSTPICGFRLLVNPFPILPGHLTISAPEHTPQTLSGNVDNLIQLAETLEGHTVFYNGPRCGASAPDHLHFQAVPSEHLTLWDTVNSMPHTHISLKGTADEVKSLIDSWLKALPHTPDSEAMVNILIHRCHPGKFQAVIFPRLRHRPKCYGALLFSPGALDMAGIMVTPRAADLNALTPELVSEIYSDVCLPQPLIPSTPIPMLSIGIVEAPEISFTDISGVRHTSDGSDLFSIAPASHDKCIEIEDVVIGKDFHWQQKQRQLLKGLLLITKHHDMAEAVNYIDVESYLASVISSEMSADAHPEFLKAHAIISRSWVLAQMRSTSNPTPPRGKISDEETVTWYDRQNHTRFHVCADDHCQRYQGFCRALVPEVVEALRQTAGIILSYQGEICDARFSKCCGGATDIFSTCWQSTDFPYLKAVADAPDSHLHLDLTDELQAQRWIHSRPNCFCGNASALLLSRSLNSYDLATNDYFRWRVEYSEEQLDSLISRKVSSRLGHILSVTPLRRGPSGRIYRLEIKGTQGRRIIGKELEIRRALSDTHLYSSAFTIRHESDRWIINGAGWGHGVGLCQIGAAQMAAEGYTCSDILTHYYPGAELTKAY